MAPIWRKARERGTDPGEPIESDDPVAGILAREGLNRSDKARRTPAESLLEAARKIASRHRRNGGFGQRVSCALPTPFQRWFICCILIMLAQTRRSVSGEPRAATSSPFPRA